MGWDRNVPLLHFRCRDIDAISLATTSHSEEDIKFGNTKSLITRRDGVERGRVVEDMIVEREFATTADSQ